MTFHAAVLTLYPEMFPGPLGASIAGRAKDEGKWALETVQIRDFAIDKHRTVDDTPAGGGAGMVLKADVLARAVDSVPVVAPILAMTPRGKPITQARIRELAAGPGAEYRSVVRVADSCHRCGRPTAPAAAQALSRPETSRSRHS